MEDGVEDAVEEGGRRRQAAAPGLTFVATPIGNARDITLRALDVLGSADVLAAEDTRTLRHLMEIHAVPVAGRPVLAYHDHNGPEMRPRLIAAMREGKSVAYASEAGMPLVADPGYALAREAIAAGLPVTCAPGPSAALTALAVSGLPSDRFLFAGFLPSAAAARRAALAELRDVPATLVLFESPRRVQALLDEARAVLGDRETAVCRELTKRFEEVLRGRLDTVRTALAGRTLKGEVVVLFARAEAARDEADLDAALAEALGRLRLKDAVDAVAGTLGLPRRAVYRRALEIAGRGGGD